MIKIQNTNLRLVPTIDQYPEPIWMLVQTINNSVLSTALYSSLTVPMMWISLASSTAIFNKTTQVVTFQLRNSKTVKLTRKNFPQLLMLLVSGTFMTFLLIKYFICPMKWCISQFLLG
ncbi:unnamed protein product [Lactuca virosa]|uniref:ER membrane protein complex subunit 4 n=1 Tax=Lactuca virosa TaxID=75947 RepID=A0AAU9LIU3_9ASTR|nr:unnamed protein product [Lactuca virosa]